MRAPTDRLLPAIRPSRRILPVGILAAGLLFNLPLVRGQTFQLGGGSSSLFQASGGSVEVHAPNYEGWVGVGSLNGQMRLGAYLSTQWRGTTLGWGDNTIPFRFPTDIFDSSHYLLGRGASIAVKKKRFSLFAFGGATSQGFSSPFFRGARAENGVGLLFLDVKLTPKLQLFSRNIISNRQTSINGLEWQPRAGVKAALAAGVGANQGYLGSTVAVDRRWLSLKAGYFVAGSRFRRIVIQSPLSSETDRENILVTLHPKPFLDFTVGHFNFLQPASDTSAALRATLNQYSASARAARFTLTASWFDSRVRGTRTEGTSVSLRRDFASRVQTGITFFHSRSGRTPSSTSLVPMIREVISPRFSLLQMVTHTNGQT